VITDKILFCEYLRWCVYFKLTLGPFAVCCSTAWLS